MTTDLFGEIITAKEPLPPGVKKRRETVPNGYAAPPGTGPKGETCKGCEHYSGHRRSKIYRKCELVRARWTGGAGTDIKAGSPACAYWKKREEAP